MGEEHDPLALGQSLQEQMIALIRAFGLHRPDQTSCGKPVSVAEAHALMELTHQEPLSQNELALRLQLEKSTVSRVVTLLEERGWISRERDARDRRAVQLRLTEAGHQVAAQIASERQAKFERILERIPVAERDGVIHALDVLVEALRDH